ncbi:MAG: glycoside hydrolase family 3 C-terminal domain-containing protein [Leeuwenhoekiella sp.]
MKIKLLPYYFLVMVTGALQAQVSQIDESFLNPTLKFEERVQILVSQMTTDEKISQLMNDAPAIERLKIPKYNWWNECLHGVARNGFATVFPQSITVAASFNKPLINEIGIVIADEARAKYHHALRQGKREIYGGLDFWSPNINIFRDPRWGRGHETYGEDPYLTGELATAFIKGLQGDDPKYLKTIATAKHFAVHSGPEALRHSFDVDVSERDLYETYLPAFRKTVKDAKVYSVMGAYNRFRGESASGHDFLLNQLLRKQWGFDGYVVSDCRAIRDIKTGHHLADTEAEAASIGLKGGCDLNCGNYYQYLNEALDQGLVTEKDIDQALSRLLLARFKMGMFDPDDEVPFTMISEDIVCSSAHNTLARKASQESIVLLQNRNQLLPLKNENISKIAVIGPNADNWESLVGNYHGTPKNPVTFLKGITNKVQPEIEILYAEGAHLGEDKHNLKPIPGIYLETNEGSQGLMASYYDNMEWSGDPVLQRVDDNIHFWWEHQPISKKLIDNFSIKWEGVLKPKKSGNYELGIFSKRGMRVLIAGKEISNGKGSEHHGLYATQTVALEAGKKYPLEAYYFSDKSNAHAHLLWAMPDENLIDRAVAVTKEADIAVVVLGLSQRLEGEDGDRTDIALPKEQLALLQAVKATGKPVVLVINAGSALALNWAKENIDTILSVGYPGEEGGNALADVLFGDYNPAGRLPITYYSSLEELPPFENYDMDNRTYRYYGGTPLFPFGYGLSYTDFEYSNIDIPKQMRAGDTLTLRVQVTNTGKLAGDEVVQLYLKDNKASTPRPTHQLEGFKRIHLKAGESKTVTFHLTPRQFSVINKKEKRVIEPGWFTLFVGGGQPHMKNTSQVISANLLVKGKMAFDER